ncbi:MAG: DUF1015 domain-containing protein [Acidimicrobiia bacterium]
MPEFLPFRGIRYAGPSSSPGEGPDDLGAVVAPPYDVVDDDDRAVLAARDPHNAVRLILPRDDGATDRYTAAARLLEAWRRDGVLVADPAPAFYAYRMHFVDGDGRERSSLGVLGALTLEEPGRGILPHERTLPKAKSDRLALLRATRANLDPIWGLSLTEGLSTLLEPAGRPLAHAVDDDGVSHELFGIADPDRIGAIADAVGQTPLVLADGHHRFETARNYQRERDRQDGGAGAIMALVVELADDQLWVQPIHRLLHGFDATFDLRVALGAAFTVESRGPNTPDGVDTLHHEMEMETAPALGLVDRDGLALLVPRTDVIAARVEGQPRLLRDIPATVFAGGVLPALPEPAETHVTYRDDARTCAALVDKGAASAAVLLRSVSVRQIHDVSFARLLMPQKTTFFAPKPRTGLVFRSLDV